MKKNTTLILSFTILIGLFSISCKKKTNDVINKQFTKEFYEDIAQIKAEKFDFNYDELVPQESYLVNGKIKFLKIRHNPEKGYDEAKIVFDYNDSIEKFIYRTVSLEPYKDFVYEVFPKDRKTYTYSDNQIIDSTYLPEINYWNKEFINEIKKTTEQQFALQ